MTGLLGRPNLVRVKLADPSGVDARLAPDRLTDLRQPELDIVLSQAPVTMGGGLK